jgi:hypothetical protein
MALPGAHLLAALALLAGGLCGARPAGGGYAQMSDAEVSATIARAHAIEPLGARLQAVTEPFLGTPYLLGNMGEGESSDGRDPDPRYNVKQADCTTFVEHAISFALARDLPEARLLLDRIRYENGIVDYGKRRHWPEAQWVRGLIAEGFLEEATFAVAGPGVKVEEAVVQIDATLLHGSAHAELKEKLRPDEVPVGTFAVPFVPIGSAAALEPRLEGGLVMNVVKAPKAGLLTRISHQTLLVRKGGLLLVRNASSVGEKAVVDEPFAEFVERQARARSWPTVGFNFLRVRAPPK